MWMLYCFLILFVVRVVTAGGNVTVTCSSCKNPLNFEGKVGENLNVSYKISDTKFQLLTIHYNGTQNQIEISPSKINSKKVQDGRFFVPSKMSNRGDSLQIVITLKGLTLMDNGVKFSYVYMDYNLDEYHGENTVKVLGPPTFCQPPLKMYNIEEGKNNDDIEFSVCGNPKPKITASVGSGSIPVISKGSSGAYKYNYGVVLRMNKRECGDKLNIKAENFASVSFDSALKLLFKPDNVENVAAYRDENNNLIVTWEKLEYGGCHVRYHIKRTTNTTTEIFGTFSLTYFFRDAVGNNTISVNAEINEKEGAYSHPIFVAAVVREDTSNTAAVKQGDLYNTGQIIGITAGIVIPCLIICAVFVILRRRRNLSDYVKRDVDKQPLSWCEPVDTVDREYVDVHNIMQKLQEQEQDEQRRQQQQQLQQQHTVYAELGPGGVPNQAPPSYKSHEFSDDSAVSKSKQSLLESNDGSYDYAASVIV